MRRPEPVQKGNPHKLTVNQHIFPTESIKRFMHDGGVEVREKVAGRTLRRRPDDVLFCALRVWDHRSEHGFMLEIENAYQRVADKIIGGHRELNEADHSSITDFYLLWHLRQRARSAPPTFPKLTGWKPERVITGKDAQEQFEKSGVIYWNKNEEIPIHILTGTNLQLEVWAERERMSGTRWGIFQIMSGHGEFLVPDRLSLHSAVPLSPELCLVAQHTNRLVDFSFVGQYNGLAIENAEKYYFARHIKNCPVLLRATLRNSMMRADLLKLGVQYPR